MDEILLFRGLSSSWVERCVNQSSNVLGQPADKEIRVQIQRFSDLAERALESGDSSRLDPILEAWASRFTTTDILARQPNLCLFIQQLSITLQITVAEMLPPEHQLQLLKKIIPLFEYAYVKAAELEISARSQYTSEQLSQTQNAMDRLDRTKSDFISVTSHELRTPLTLIDGYASILRENLEHQNQAHSLNPDQDGNLQLLEGIHNGVTRLRNIVDDMLDVSVIDNKMLNLNMQPVWFNRLFTALRNELRESLKERKQNLEIAEFPGSSEMAMGDPERLLQVFRNLVTNAIKYSPDNKTIYINGRKLTGFVEILVQDEGIGIASDDIQKIFEKFYRVGNPILHSSGRTKFLGGGPGLGLHIAKGIIEAHGGAIWAESAGCDKDKCPGSTFHVLFPVKNENQMTGLFIAKRNILSRKDHNES